MGGASSSGSGAAWLFVTDPTTGWSFQKARDPQSTVHRPRLRVGGGDASGRYPRWQELTR